MTWECEYFSLAGWMLACKMRQHGGSLDQSDPYAAHIINTGTVQGAALGEMDYGAEMRRVLQEARRAHSSIRPASAT